MMLVCLPALLQGLMRKWLTGQLLLSYTWRTEQNLLGLYVMINTLMSIH